MLQNMLFKRNSNLCYIGTFGLKDELRPKVASCIEYATKKGLMGVRMVSGDHIETAKMFAYKAGILTPEDMGNHEAVMTGQEFRERVGMVENGQIQNMDAFQNIIKENKLKVIARATAEDKHILVTGLKLLNRRVAVSGEGINDVDALQAADVGMSLGSGVEITQSNSSLCLVNDDFEALLKSIMWGRNVYQNITRFLIF